MSDQFRQQLGAECFAVPDFLSTIWFNRCGALKLQWPSIVICHQQTTHVASPLNFHGFHEAQSQSICCISPRHSLPRTKLKSFCQVPRQNLPVFSLVDLRRESHLRTTDRRPDSPGFKGSDRKMYSSHFAQCRIFHAKRDSHPFPRRALRTPRSQKKSAGLPESAGVHPRKYALTQWVTGLSFCAHTRNQLPGFPGLPRWFTNDGVPQIVSVDGKFQPSREIEYSPTEPVEEIFGDVKAIQ